MRIAFAGTPAFAATALRALIAAGHEVALVLTQPDRPAGRGMALHASPVKEVALANHLLLAQPRSLRLDGKYPEDATAARDALKAAQAEALIVAAYGLILPRWVLDATPRGGLNIHGSLLPRWRGAAPIQRAIEAGDAQTGITIMQMDEGLDTGPMLLAKATAIAPDDTTASLHDRLADMGARLIVNALAAVSRGELAPTEQPSEGVTYARKIDKAEARIDWSQAAAVIERRMRAFDPFPGASTTHRGADLKLWRAHVVDVHGTPGEVLNADRDGFMIACGRQALHIVQAQRPGGKRGPAGPLAAAAGIMAGDTLG